MKKRAPKKTATKAPTVDDLERSLTKLEAGASRREKLTVARLKMSLIRLREKAKRDEAVTTARILASPEWTMITRTLVSAVRPFGADVLRAVEQAFHDIAEAP